MESGVMGADVTWPGPPLVKPIIHLLKVVAAWPSLAVYTTLQHSRTKCNTNTHTHQSNTAQYNKTQHTTSKLKGEMYLPPEKNRCLTQPTSNSRQGGVNGTKWWLALVRCVCVCVTPHVWPPIFLHTLLNIVPHLKIRKVQLLYLNYYIFVFIELLVLYMGMFQFGVHQWNIEQSSASMDNKRHNRLYIKTMPVIAPVTTIRSVKDTTESCVTPVENVYIKNQSV